MRRGVPIEAVLNWEQSEYQQLAADPIDSVLPRPLKEKDSTPYAPNILSLHE